MDFKDKLAAYHAEEESLRWEGTFLYIETAPEVTRERFHYLPIRDCTPL